MNESYLDVHIIHFGLHPYLRITLYEPDNIRMIRKFTYPHVYLTAF